MSKKLFTLFLMFFLILVTNVNLANNISVSNVTTTGQNTTDGYILVQFDISWDNSFRDATNWDAAWVFIKYKTTDGIWHHSTLNTTGHTEPTGSTIDTPADGMGVFIYRDAEGSGTFSLTNVQLRWNYSGDGVADDQEVTIKVFAIEMVYVPEGNFELGDGAAESRFYEKDGSNTSSVLISPALVTIVINGVTAYDDTQIESTGVGVDGDAGIDVDGNGSIDNSGFPTGYGAFYCMKYEISQEQYVDFLNRLTYDQQAGRTVNSPNSSVGMGALISNPPVKNNSIEIMTSGTDNTTPAVYGNDLDDDNIFNESNDGQNIACGYIILSDILSYADWAGLRPMTELEYEKACRGPESAVNNEYAWGTTNLNSSDYTINNPGEDIEGIATGFSTNSGNALTGNQTIDAPLRVGIFAANGSNDSRETAGATYYGIMEMSGNVFEKCVTIGKSNGRSFTGQHGNGELDSNGDFDVTNWTTSMMGIRGGTWGNLNQLQVSNRQYAANSSTNRGATHSFRCVRTAP